MGKASVVPADVQVFCGFVQFWAAAGSNQKSTITNCLLGVFESCERNTGILPAREHVVILWV
jgi:hypothetical protein